MTEGKKKIPAAAIYSAGIPAACESGTCGVYMASRSRGLASLATPINARWIMHLSYAQIPRRRVKLMDIEQVFRFVAPHVREAAIKAADQLNQLGLRYALAGGLAVGAYGYIRATLDVNFLVGEEAFDRQGMLVAFKAGVPIEVNGVRIDYLSPASLGSQLEE